MKELSIEAKAKRYDEAFDRARKLKENPTSVFYEYSPSEGDTVADYIFPELKESEDEKIRKRIIALINAHGQGKYKEDMLAWLEKQCEQKETLCDKCKKTQPPHSCQDITALGRCALEKQGEQKPTNIVEPKFKVGDWITNGATKPVQISSIEDDMYYTHNGTIGGDIESMDKDYHLWTLKDAKDGDILASKSGDKIFSYRGSLDLKGNPCAYYGIYKVHDGICFSPCAIGNSFTCEEVFPATKEQRKTLFEEMTTAKGVLHFNKKELKKIEQKEVIHNELTEFEKAVKQVMEEAIECGDTHNLKADAEMLLSLVHNSSWSEEDEKLLDKVIKRLHKYSAEDGEYLDKYYWLKELKHRVQLKAQKGEKA